MLVDKELCFKFPVILRDKLLNHEIEFPNETQFEYERLFTYRMVAREKDDHREVNREDFRSYFELGKTPGKKKPKGLEKDAHYYGVSSYLNKEIVEQVMRFPRPGKKLAAGYVYSEGGPQHTNDQHVCWWLYEEADVSGFKLI